MEKEMDKESSSVVSWVKRIYNSITAPATVRLSGYLVLMLYIGLLVVGVIVAATLDPDGYSIWTNYISDLGSSQHTPAPILYDLACIFAGILTIPFNLYLERYFAPIPRTPEELPAPHRWSYRLTGAGFFFAMTGSLFYIGVGIWSGDRATLNGIPMHEICSIGAFGGFAFAAIFMGFALMISDRQIVPSPYCYILGTYGVHVPISFAIFNYTGLPGFTSELLEWSLLFAIMGWIIPLAIFVLHHTHKIEQTGARI
ncbi:MAG: DUF998 domain-containing protein [Candidatus Helarchaeota archaeon]